MTIRDMVRDLTERLEKIYPTGEATAISEWLAEHLTQIRRTDRFQQDKTVVSGDQQKLAASYLARLLDHEPVQYVLQEAWFCGLKFYVDRNVLIPRPETEELVEWVISNCRFPISSLSITDIGTGSGCIPIALKKRLGKADVSGYDISEDALNVAKRNAQTLGIDVHFHQLDFLDEASRGKLPVFDIIVSNPPYIPVSEKGAMPANVTSFEPHLALFVPDHSPLLFYQALAGFASQHLHAGGSLFMEIHEDLAGPVTEELASKGYRYAIKKDMQGKDRMIRAWH